MNAELLVFKQILKEKVNHFDDILKATLKCLIVGGGGGSEFTGGGWNCLENSISGGSELAGGGLELFGNFQ